MAKKSSVQRDMAVVYDFLPFIVFGLGEGSAFWKSCPMRSQTELGEYGLQLIVLERFVDPAVELRKHIGR
jgi:hypothetical protein